MVDAGRVGGCVAGVETSVGSCCAHGSWREPDLAGRTFVCRVYGLRVRLRPALVGWLRVGGSGEIGGMWHVQRISQRDRETTEKIFSRTVARDPNIFFYREIAAARPTSQHATCHKMLRNGCGWRIGFIRGDKGLRGRMNGAQGW